MLAYQTIYQVEQAQDRLRRDAGRYRWNTSHTFDSDTLLVFTMGQEAEQAAQNNLDFCLGIALDHDVDYLVLHDNKIQFLGRRIREGIMTTVAPGPWAQDYMTWSDSRSINISSDNSGQGELYGLRSWRRAFATRKTQGIYEVASGTRLKNRRDIIERFWSLGYAAWRGRPLCVSSVRQTGTRAELEVLTKLADQYWHRRHSSDAAKKMCAAYTSLNRYAAWPGAW